MFGIAVERTLGMSRRQRGPIDRVAPSFVAKVKFDSEKDFDKSPDSGAALNQEGGQLITVAQIACWVLTVVYVGWLFILPYAPVMPFFPKSLKKFVKALIYENVSSSW
jgi:hypothetical protein